MRARGASANPPNRFERLTFAPGAEELERLAGVDPRTEILVDPSRGIVATNDSPDIGFDASVNPYRGCEHGCTYCYARPTHEYLGYSAGIDFETKILAKPRGPELLRRKLASRHWKPQVIAISGVTDPYQPVERHLEITRGCLKVLAEFRNPVALITKGWLVTRDRDVLSELAAHDAASVAISITSLDPDVQRRMEPRAATPDKRLAAVEMLARAGVPVGVMVAPVVPGLTDHEIPAILRAVADAGASWASKVLLRLPHGTKEIFERWLEEHYPDRRAKVMNRVRATRGGRLYDSRYHTRQRGTGFHADHIDELFDLSLRRARLARRGPELSVASFRRPHGPEGQLDLFA